MLNCAEYSRTLTELTEVHAPPPLLRLSVTPLKRLRLSIQMSMVQPFKFTRVIAHISIDLPFN